MRSSLGRIKRSIALAGLFLITACATTSQAASAPPHATPGGAGPGSAEPGTVTPGGSTPGGSTPTALDNCLPPGPLPWLGTAAAAAIRPMRDYADRAGTVATAWIRSSYLIPFSI